MSADMIDNQSGCAALPLFLADEEGRPVVAVVAAAGWAIAADGSLTPLPEPPAIELADAWWGEPGLSSLRLAGEAVFVKPATDIVVQGQAHAARPGARQGEVSIAVGPVSCAMRVSGDRVWQKRLLGRRISEPVPFECIPLRYEQAFGGCQAEPPAGEERNPVGRGWVAPKAPFVDGTPLPNLEDPADPVTAWGKPAAVIGCGLIASHWQPRRALAGTYDAAWERERQGRLPRDFDRRFFNAAALTLSLIHI